MDQTESQSDLNGGPPNINYEFEQGSTEDSVTQNQFQDDLQCNKEQQIQNKDSNNDKTQYAEIESFEQNSLQKTSKYCRSQDTNQDITNTTNNKQTMQLDQKIDERHKIQLESVEDYQNKSIQIFNQQQKEQIKNILRTFSTEKLSYLNDICKNETLYQSSVDPFKILLDTIATKQFTDLIDNEWNKFQNSKISSSIKEFSEDAFDELIHAEFFSDEECLLLPPVIFDENMDKSEVNSKRNEWEELKRCLNITPKNTAHLEIYFEDKLLEKRSYNWCQDFLKYGFGFKPRNVNFVSEYQDSENFDFENRLKSLWTKKNNLKELKLRFVEGEIRRGANKQAISSNKNQSVKKTKQLQNLQDQNLFEVKQQVSCSNSKMQKQQNSSAQIEENFDSNVRSRFQYFIEPNQIQKQQNQLEWDADMDLIDFPKENETVVTLPQVHLEILNSLESLNNMITDKLKDFLQPSNSQNWWIIDEQTIQLFQSCKEQDDDKFIARCDQLILVRQCAELLVEYGIKIAHLFFSKETSRVDIVESWIVYINNMLEKALESVNRNELCDHPKLDALRQLLICSYTLKPENKILLVARKAAFFTLYNVLHISNISVQQIERDKVSVDNIAEQVADAIQNANCILTSFNSVNLPNFPFSKFGLTVLYQTNEQTSNLLRQSGVPIHVLKVQTINSPQDNEVPASNIDSNTNPGAPTAINQEASCSKHSEVSTNNIHRNDEGLTGKNEMWQQQLQYCIVACQHPESMIKSRRMLYETVLTFERQGLTIFERPLHGVDMALSCSCALTVWTQQLLTPQNDRSLQQHIFDVIVRQIMLSSLAYSKLILIVEGSDSFLNTFLNFTPKFTFIAQRAQTHLQVYPSSQQPQTIDLLKQFIQAEQQNRTLSNEPQFQLSDIQNPIENFLNSFPSMNPLSAAILSQNFSSIFLLLENLLKNAENIIASCPFISKHSLELLQAQITARCNNKMDDDDILQEFNTQQCIENMQQYQDQQQQPQIQGHQNQYQHYDNQQYQQQQDLQQYQQYQQQHQQDGFQQKPQQQYIQQQQKYQYQPDIYGQQYYEKQQHRSNQQFNNKYDLGQNLNDKSLQLFNPDSGQNQGQFQKEDLGVGVGVGVDMRQNQNVFSNSLGLQNQGYQNNRRVDQEIYKSCDYRIKSRNFENVNVAYVQNADMNNNYERNRDYLQGANRDGRNRRQLSIIREVENEGDLDCNYDEDMKNIDYRQNYMNIQQFDEYDKRNNDNFYQVNSNGFLRNQYSPTINFQPNYQINQIQNNFVCQQNQNQQTHRQLQQHMQQRKQNQFTAARNNDNYFAMQNQCVLDGNDDNYFKMQNQRVLDVNNDNYFAMQNQRVLDVNETHGQIDRFFTPSRLNSQLRSSPQQNIGSQIQQKQSMNVRDVFQDSPINNRNMMFPNNTLCQEADQYPQNFNNLDYQSELSQRQILAHHNAINMQQLNNTFDAHQQRNPNYCLNQTQKVRSPIYDNNYSNNRNFEFQNQYLDYQDMQNNYDVQTANFGGGVNQGVCREPRSQLRKMQAKLGMQISPRSRQR